MKREEKERLLMANIPMPLFETTRSHYLHKVSVHLSHAFLLLHGKEIYERGYEVYDYHRFNGLRSHHMMGDITIPTNNAEVIEVCDMIKETLVQQDISKIITLIHVYDSEWNVDQPNVVSATIRIAVPLNS